MRAHESANKRCNAYRLGPALLPWARSPCLPAADARQELALSGACRACLKQQSQDVCARTGRTCSGHSSRAARHAHRLACLVSRHRRQGDGAGNEHNGIAVPARPAAPTSGAFPCSVSTISSFYSSCAVRCTCRQSVSSSRGRRSAAALSPWGTLTRSSRDCACAELSTLLSMTLLSPSCFPTSNSGNRRCLGVSAGARLQKRARPAPPSRRNQPACDTAAHAQRAGAARASATAKTQRTHLYFDRTNKALRLSWLCSLVERAHSSFLLLDHGLETMVAKPRLSRPCPAACGLTGAPTG